MNGMEILLRALASNQQQVQPQQGRPMFDGSNDPRTDTGFYQPNPKPDTPPEPQVADTVDIPGYGKMTREQYFELLKRVSLPENTMPDKFPSPNPGHMPIPYFREAAEKVFERNNRLKQMLDNLGKTPNQGTQ